ncbi:DUF2835 domain-containing protein [Pseudoalteromonas mariniglutinosa]|uniref:DUF2835 domain-containing protein n=1 Tax=Pseudoalteromonas mariniglutinosa TaxID=206042 RepID=UPI00384B13D6
MNSYFFSLHLSYKQCMDYYYGAYTSVQVTEDGGKKIRFPAAYLRPYITAIGIRGRFRMTVTSDNKFVKLEKVS